MKCRGENKNQSLSINTLNNNLFIIKSIQPNQRMNEKELPPKYDQNHVPEDFLRSTNVNSCDISIRMGIFSFKKNFFFFLSNY